MKVKMLTTYAGPLGTFNAGATPDVTPEMAKILLDAGAIGPPAIPGPVAVESAETQEPLLPMESDVPILVVEAPGEAAAAEPAERKPARARKAKT